jgi:hypothetical protein
MSTTSRVCSLTLLRAVKHRESEAETFKMNTSVHMTHRAEVDTANGVPADRLAEHIQANVNEPALIFPGRLVLETMKQLNSGIPLVHVAPWHEFQLPYALSFFLGATYNDNPSEDEHLHPAQAELYIPVAGHFASNVLAGGVPRSILWNQATFSSSHLAVGIWLTG